jgi:hypothetical protein
VFWGHGERGQIWKRAKRASYCVAKNATHRAARPGPSATIKPSPRDDNVESGVAVGIPQDDEPVLRDDKGRR